MDFYHLQAKLDYHEFPNIFSKENSDEISPYKLYDYYIQLKEGTKPFYGPSYRMNHEKNKELYKYLLENYDKRFIRVSQSLVVSPILFMVKLKRDL